MNQVNKILIVSFSYFLFANKTLANVLSSQNGNFAKLTFNNKDYCFEVSENSIKPIKNLGSCKNLEALYATNNESICLESTSIDCNPVVANGDSYEWGNSGSITFYESISNLQSGKPTTSQSTNNLAKLSTVTSNSSGDMSGEELYKKAKEYFDNKEYQLAYDFARRSADKNYKGGYFGLGLAYEKGYGVVEKNIPRAIRMYQKAADLGHVGARGQVKRLTKKDSDNSISSIKQGVWKNGQYKCTGNYINFDSVDSYWENITVSGSKVTVPKFGEYRFVVNHNKADWYLMPGKEKEGRYNFVKVMTNNNNPSRSVTFSIKKGGHTLQMQGQCSRK